MSTYTKYKAYLTPNQQDKLNQHLQMVKNIH